MSTRKSLVMITLSNLTISELIELLKEISDEIELRAMQLES